MLRGTFAFLALVVFAVFGSELRGVLARRGLRVPAMEGLSFLVVGLVLGARGLGLFADDLLRSMRIVVLFGLAWIGFVFGVQIERRIFRRLTPWHRRVGWLTPIALGLPVFGGGLVVGLPVALAVGLGAVAMVPSPSLLEASTRGRQIANRRAFQILRLVMAFAGMPAVIAFAFAAALASPLTEADGGTVPTWQLVTITAAVGLLIGYALVVLTRGVTEHMRLLTLAAGTMCLVAGSSAVLGVSALPAAACAGAVLVNRGVFPNRMLRVAHSLDRPILIALLVLVGASWRGASFSFAAFGLLTVVRTIAALIVGEVVMKSASSRRHTPRLSGFGFGLLPLGELALGLLVAIISFFPDTAGVLEAVVAAIIVNNFIGSWWIRRRLDPPTPNEAEP